jgi:hypothetical protein
MTNKVPNLWPEDFEAPPVDDMPVVILREQATMLGQKTRYLVEAEVKTETGFISPQSRSKPPPWAPKQDHEARPSPVLELMHRFTLRAPALANYQYDLLTVHQPMEIYPLRIDFDGKSSSANSKEEFLEALREIFSAETTKRIIGTLIAQSTG